PPDSGYRNGTRHRPADCRRASGDADARQLGGRGNHLYAVASPQRASIVSAGRILVVDDDPQIRRVMRVTLTAQAYEVDDVKHGEAALEKIRDQQFDLVLLDMNVPGMGGLETCREIRAAS